jgi:hypothetical protein
MKWNAAEEWGILIEKAMEELILLCFKVKHGGAPVCCVLYMDSLADGTITKRQVFLYYSRSV